MPRLGLADYHDTIAWTHHTQCRSPWWSRSPEVAQDLVLPGLGWVPPDTVVPLSTNAAIVEAYLVGLCGRSCARRRGIPGRRTGRPNARTQSEAVVRTLDIRGDILPSTGTPAMSRRSRSAT